MAAGGGERGKGEEGDVGGRARFPTRSELQPPPGPGRQARPSPLFTGWPGRPIGRRIASSASPRRRSPLPPSTERPRRARAPGAPAPPTLLPRLAGLLLVLLAGAGCDDGPYRPVGGETTLRERFDLEALGAIPYPADNERRPERIELGRLLFYDPVLAGERDVSCGACHHPSLAFADGRALAVGAGGTGLGPGRTPGPSSVTGRSIPVEPRSAPTVLNSAFNGAFGPEPRADGSMLWDGRVRSLEAQPTLPLLVRVEMRGDAYPEEVALDSVMARLRSIPGYVERFRRAFPDRASAADPAAVIDSSAYVRAVAAFVRELVGRDSPYDRYVRGENGALSARQRRGLELFFGEAGCARCHRGPMLSDFSMAVHGTPQVGPGKERSPGDDLGRMEETGDPADRYAFRVPTLRNVELTAPYMHDGVFATLEEVVRFYDRGARPRHERITDAMLHPALREPLGLTDTEIDDLVAFLESLTDPGFALPPALRSVPESVPSGLPPVLGTAAGS